MLRSRGVGRSEGVAGRTEELMGARWDIRAHAAVVAGLLAAGIVALVALQPRTSAGAPRPRGIGAEDSSPARTSPLAKQLASPATSFPRGSQSR
ncbi:MAG: hypothetical protein ACRDHK_15000, partial [Actinomycetota bacterium]